MKYFVFLVACFYMCHFITAIEEKKVDSPKVQVYSRNPGMYGEDNVLICHTSGFHPPEIKIDLLKDGVEIPGANQTDLAFEDTWQYHLTKHVPFKPMAGEKYVCRVTHMGNIKDHYWEADM